MDKMPTVFSKQKIRSRHENWSIADFLVEYSSQRIYKPRLQRKLAWGKKEMKKFIEFLMRVRDSNQTMYINEVDGKRYLFDGNNRGNAIVSFCNNPIQFVPEVVPVEFEYAIPLLETLPLSTFHGVEEIGRDGTARNRPFNYQRFKQYAEGKLQIPNIDKNEEGFSYESLWDDMIDTMKTWDLFNSKIYYVIYENLSHEEMCYIYESINTTGKKLTHQELLASITAHNLYTARELTLFPMLQPVIESYYSKMNDSECFKMDESIYEMNAYEILLSLQIYLSKKYEFICEPNPTEKEYDILFTLYKNHYGDFNTKQEMNKFIDMVLTACNLLQDTLDCLFDKNLFKKHQKMKKNNTAVLLAVAMYMRATKAQLYTILLNHILEGENDKLCYKTGGHIIPELLKDIKTGKLEIKFELDYVRALLCTRIKESVKCTVGRNKKDRKPKSKLLIIALSAFYQHNVPPGIKTKKHDIDHIVPFSFTSTVPYDTCRLGNKQIIHSSINKKRKIKPITDEWIRDNDLTHQYYPSEEEYAAVCQGKVVTALAYNTMCEKREKMYVNIILQNCI